MEKKIYFVTGGCRSGKSGYAEKLTLGLAGSRKLYIATCVPYDDEMQDRVDRHKHDRGDVWDTDETPVNIQDVIEAKSCGYDGILVDCLTLWISNLMMENDEAGIMAHADRLAEALKNSKCPVVLVSNEVGAGIVPENQVARQFRDYAGFVNQKIAAAADAAYWLVSGLPVQIK